MKKIMTLLASNSSESINNNLLDVISEKITEHQLTRVKVGDFPMPIYSSDIEKNDGFPETIAAVKALFAEHDAFIIASPEHNGSMPAVFKNFIDWLSRAVESGSPMFDNKPVLLVSTSPGPRGGATNIQNLTNIMPYWGADIRGSYSVGSYNNNYKDGQFSEEHNNELNQLVKDFVNGLSTEV